MRISFFIWLFSLAVGVNAQKIDERQVPPQVVGIVKANCLSGDSVVWYKHFTIYQARIFSKTEGPERHIQLTESGNTILKELSVEVAGLPNLITQFIVKNFPTMEICRAFLVEHFEMPQVRYRLEIGEAEVLFDSQGDFIQISQRILWEEPFTAVAR